jgi:hypothetical protein
MSAYNARLIEKNIFTNDTPTGGEDSLVVDLNGASKFSCQAVYDVMTFSAAAIDSSTDIFASTDPTHPSQFHKVAHGFVTGLKVQVATTTALPTPLLILTNYFVIKIDANYFQLASSLSNAVAGTQIALSDVGTGTQTVTAVALAGASVTFQKSNDGSNWVNIQSATSITVDGSVLLVQPDVSYRYFKAVKALTSGDFTLAAYVLVIGDAT